MELTVIATGNLLMADDGVAVRIIERLEKEPALSHVEYLDGSVGGLRLLNWIEQAKRLLFVDAARAPADTPPGTCRLFTLDELLGEKRGQSPSARRGLSPFPSPCSEKGTVPLSSAKKGTVPFSLHQTDLLGVLTLAKQFYRVPPTWLLAIAVQSVQPGDALSAPLAAALPRLTETVRRLAQRLARR